MLNFIYVLLLSYDLFKQITISQHEPLGSYVNLKLPSTTGKLTAVSALLARVDRCERTAS